MVFKDVRLEFTKFGDNLQKYSEVYDLAISCWISSVVHRELWIISGIAYLSTLSSINWNRRVEQGYLFLCGGEKRFNTQRRFHKHCRPFSGKTRSILCKIQKQKRSTGDIRVDF